MRTHIRTALGFTAIVVAYCAVSTMDYTDQAAEAEHTAAVLHDARLTSQESKALESRLNEIVGYDLIAGAGK